MAAPLTVVSGKTCTLAQRLRSTGSDTSITISSTETPLYTTGVMKFGSGSGSEWISFTGVFAVSGTTYTLTGCTRGLDKDATSLTDNSSGGKKDHSVGTTGRYVLHSAQINKYVQNDADNTISGDNAFTGVMTHTSTTKAGDITQNVTTTQRDALTGVANGLIIYNTTAGEFQIYQAGAWSTMASGSTQPNMSLTVAGKGEEATAAEIIANTQTGGTSAELVVNPKYLGDASVITSAGAADASKYIRANASGILDSTMLTGITYSIDSIRLTGTAGEALTANDLVYFKSADSKWRKGVDGTDSWNVSHMVKTSVSADATVTLIPLIGRISPTTALTANTTYYRSSTGTLTSTRPSMSSSTIVPLLIGTTDAAGGLVCNRQRLQRRLFTNFTPTAADRTITVGFPISHVYAQHLGYDGTVSRQLSSGYYDAIAGTQESARGSNLIDSFVGAGTTQTVYTASIVGSDLYLTYAGNSVTGTQKVLLEIFEAL